VTFTIWDNHRGEYWDSDEPGRPREFESRVAAERARENFIANKDRQDDWRCRLDIHQVDANLCFHLREKWEGDHRLYLYPVLLPVYFEDVPAAHWRLYADDGSELGPGSQVRTFRGELTQLVRLLPPHKLASEGKVNCRNRLGGEDRRSASVIGGTYRYVPPLNDLNEAGLRWASSGRWKAPPLLTLVNRADCRAAPAS